MGTQGVEIFAKAVAQDPLSHDPLVANHISNRILKAAENFKTVGKLERAESTEAIGIVGEQEDVLDNETNPVIRMTLAAYRSDFFPVLLLLAIYTLFAFGAALFVL